METIKLAPCKVISTNKLKKEKKNVLSILPCFPSV